MSNVAQLINRIAEPEFFSAISDYLYDSVQCHSLVIMIYDQSHMPEVLFNGVKEKTPRTFEKVYLTGAYLLSPLFQAHKDKRIGCFRLKDISPDAFFSSEYYKCYYEPSGLTDQLFYLHPLIQDKNKNQTLVVSLGLINKAYSTSEFQCFAQQVDVIKAAINKHLQLVDLALPESFNTCLQNTYQQFGVSVLTAREQKVIHALLQGHSSKSCARMLNISVETERSYRKSAYSKLEVSSQGELFNLFFQCLKLADKVGEKDPLVLVLPHICG